MNHDMNDLVSGHGYVWELGSQAGDSPVWTRADGQRHRGGLVDTRAAALPYVGRLHQARGQRRGQIRKLVTGIVQAFWLP